MQVVERGVVPSDEMTLILGALSALKRGDASVRLPIEWTGVAGRVADAFNDVIETNQRMAQELERLSHVVGKLGKLGKRGSLGDVTGFWRDSIDAVNQLIDDLVHPTSETARVIGAVAQGDLSQTMALEVDGEPLQGEFLRTAKTVNKMVDQLGSFASEVTRVARGVGTEGKLGGQAAVKGVAGTWKDLTDSVSSMAGNLTAQVRNIADGTTAVATGDLSKKIAADVKGEFLELKDTINTMVDQLRSDNALLYHRIQESDQRKNEFLAMLAHELRNPLAPIMNAVHVLRAASDETGQVGWAREVIGRQLKQLTRLVDDLLDLSRITRGKIELKLDALDAGEVVAAAVETSRPLIDAQRHTLALHLPEAPVGIRGDFARVAQILGNLINNAAKYTDPGGRIDITLAQEGGNAVFRVKDTGMGMPQNALGMVFEPFTQLERTLDRSQGGLGIGLTLVRRLVEMQGGSVAAHSEGPGHGCEFVVRLPAIEAPRAHGQPAAHPAVGPATPEPPQQSPMTVLVVDDNPDVAESTAILLRVAGCTVHVAVDGKTALAALESVQPDAVLLDIGLPGMDGYQVAERMRERPELRRTLIVAVSGYGEDEHQVRSREAGVDHHLVKPIDPAAVMALLAGRARDAEADGNRRGVPVAPH